MDEIIFIPQKAGKRLKEYIRGKGLQPDDRIFPVGYGAAWFIVKKAGKRIGVDISPHDLRRHAATFANRSGTPIEIVSKGILRSTSLSTTQRYLGKVSYAEALRGIETVYG